MSLNRTPVYPAQVKMAPSHGHMDWYAYVNETLVFAGPLKYSHCAALQSKKKEPL